LDYSLFIDTENVLREVQERYNPMTDTIIHDPGKFEGEHISVPHFWDSTLDGCADDVYSDDVMYSFIVIDTDDRAKFPDLTEYGFMLWEDSQGFVHTKWFDTQVEYETAKSDVEKAADLEADDDDESDDSDDDN
jgi:hypothetical protein